MSDFERALDEVRPAFGADEEQFEGYRLNGIVSWDIRFPRMHAFESVEVLG